MQDFRQDRRHALLTELAARMNRVRGNKNLFHVGRLDADMVRTAERFAEIDATPGALLPDLPPDEIARLVNLGPQ